jgi:hypothetical protein
MAFDGDSQAMEFVKPDMLHRPRLSVGQDHGFADEFSLGLLQRTEDRRRAKLRKWHGVSGVRREASRGGVFALKHAQLVTGS